MTFTYKRAPKSTGQLVREFFENKKLEEQKKLQEDSLIDLYPENKPLNAYEKYLMRESASKASLHNKYQFQEDVKKELLYHSLFDAVIAPIMQESYANSHQMQVASKTVVDFINEEGADSLIKKLQEGNLYMVNLASLIDETSQLIMETAKDRIREGLSEKDAYSIENEKIDDFIINAKDTIPADLNKVISDRVEDSINDFIADNKENKLRVKQIYDKAREKITMADGNPELQESYLRQAKRQEMEITESSTNVFGAMTKIMIESVYKIKPLKESYTNDMGKVDFAKVVGDVRSMYTCLEAFNTLGVVNADTEYLAKTLKEMKESMEKVAMGIPSAEVEKDANKLGDKKEPKELSGDHEEGAGLPMNTLKPAE